MEKHEGRSIALELENSRLEAAKAAPMLEQRLHSESVPGKVYRTNRLGMQGRRYAPAGAGAGSAAAGSATKSRRRTSRKPTPAPTNARMAPMTRISLSPEMKA
jgi:hypothetical protein